MEPIAKSSTTLPANLISNISPSPVLKIWLVTTLESEHDKITAKGFCPFSSSALLSFDTSIVSFASFTYCSLPFLSLSKASLAVLISILSNVASDFASSFSTFPLIKKSYMSAISSGVRFWHPSYGVKFLAILNIGLIPLIRWISDASFSIAVLKIFSTSTIFLSFWYITI